MISEYNTALGITCVLVCFIYLDIENKRLSLQDSWVFYLFLLILTISKISL